MCGLAILFINILKCLKKYKMVNFKRIAMGAGVFLFANLVLYGQRNNFIKEAFKNAEIKKQLEEKKRKAGARNIDFEAAVAKIQAEEAGKVAIKKAKK